MELLNNVSEILKSAESYKKTTNFYFESHECPQTSMKQKVMLDYMIKTETSDKIIKFGQCKDCKVVFYHEDFGARSF